MKFGEACSTKRRRIVYPLLLEDGKLLCFNVSDNKVEYYKPSDLKRNASHDMIQASVKKLRSYRVMDKMALALRVAREDYKQRLRNLFENTPSFDNDTAIQEINFKIERIQDIDLEYRSVKGKK